MAKKKAKRKTKQRKKKEESAEELLDHVRSRFEQFTEGQSLYDADDAWDLWMELDMAAHDVKRLAEVMEREGYGR